MKPVACPSCGAAVEFHSAAAIAVVCPYCGSNLVRRDLDVESLGKIAALQEDGSVLQLGTSGKYQGRAFTLAGRLQRGWEQGYWSEWYADFGDAREGWLAEAMGWYYFTFRQNATVDLPAFQIVKPGGPLMVNGLQWEAADRKKCKVVSAAGEFPAQIRPGLLSETLDLVAPGKKCATIEHTQDGELSFYAGEFMDFADLHLVNLRPVDGW